MKEQIVVVVFVVFGMMMIVFESLFVVDAAVAVAVEMELNRVVSSKQNGKKKVRDPTREQFER